jgi:hypothetical protein
MQTLTTAIQWSAVTFAAYMILSTLFVGNAMFA